MWRNLFYSFLLVILVALVLVRFAEPVGDGDLFWQMAYGRYMVEHLTLVPDHTVFSWTPATNDTIYCSWIAEIVFYGLHSLAGLPLLFAFRYACIFLAVWLAFDYMRRIAAREPQLGLPRRPEVFLYLAIAIIAGYVGTILKPEIFSLVCFHVLAWGYFRMKLEARDPGQPGTRSLTWWLLFFPLLMLFWVNSHGVFMFGLVALLVLCAGEWANRWLVPEMALPGDYLKKFTLASLLSVVACFITPYGYRYPLQLLRELGAMVGGSQSVGDAVAYASLAAHQKTVTMTLFHFVPLAVVMVAALLWYFGLQGALGQRGKKIDLALVGVNLVLGVLYFWYARTTYYWPSFWLYTCLYSMYVVAHTSERGATLLRTRWLPATLATLLFVGLCTGSMLQSIYAPYTGSFFGFGITYFNPVDEAEWIERFDPQAIIYNDYDGGGYLLWRLYPRTKVMIDPRSFPYRKWYGDYHLWEQGSVFRELLEAFPQRAELAVVSYKNQRLWRSFAASGEWLVAWMGNSSAIWVRQGRQYPTGAADFKPNRFRELKNFQRSVEIFQMCMELQLYDTGFAVLRAMSGKYTLPEERATIDNMIIYKEALDAENVAGNLDKALLLHEECRRRGFFYSDPKLMELYKWKVGQLTGQAQTVETTQQLRDLAVRMSAVSRGEAPPPPLKKLHGPPVAASPATAAPKP